MSWLIAYDPLDALPHQVRSAYTGEFVAGCVTADQAQRLLYALEAGDVAPLWEVPHEINGPASLTEFFLQDARDRDQIRASKRGDTP